jgi:hypothetical protein
VRETAAEFNLIDIAEILPQLERRYFIAGTAPENGLGAPPSDGSSAATNDPPAGKFARHPDAQPPPEKFKELGALVPEFLQIWERQNPPPDTSPSGWDWALLRYPVLASWTGQECTDLLIAYRRKHGEELKLEHDYYERTYANRQRKLLEPELATATDQPEEPAAPDPVASLVFDPGASVPLHEVDAVGAAQPQFLRALNRVRRAGENPNTNFATECQRLANYALVASKTDQWVLNLLISLHRARGYTDNGLNYFGNIIRSAHDSADTLREEQRLEKIVTEQKKRNRPVESSEADDVKEQIADGAAVEEAGADFADAAEKKRCKARADLRQILGLDIYIDWHQTQPSRYRLKTNGRSVELKEVKEFTVQSKLREHLEESARIHLPKLKPAVWDRAAQLLLDLCEPIPGGPGSSDYDFMRYALEQYLDSVSVHSNHQDSDKMRAPFRDDDGNIWVNSLHLQNWLRKTMNESLSRPDITTKLRAFGARPAKELGKNLRVDDNRRSYWRLPPGDYIPQTEVSDK